MGWFRIWPKFVAFIEPAYCGYHQEGLPSDILQAGQEQPKSISRERMYLSLSLEPSCCIGILWDSGLDLPHFPSEFDEGRGHVHLSYLKSSVRFYFVGWNPGPCTHGRHVLCH